MEVHGTSDNVTSRPSFSIECQSNVNSRMFRVQVVNDAAAAGAAADTVREGGDTPAARRGTFLDLALCLAGGLHDSGLATLFKTAALGLPVGDPLVPYHAHPLLRS
jgi:hypothetical protein